ncbi:MAG TPA: sensor histidine kinase [Actinomycetaceae bacterium]|nr:sensor histidine kinase [Actinomycetaceae bacterium]
MDTDTQPVTARPVAAPRPAQWWRRLVRDYGFVLPGFPLAVFSVGLLVPMTAASLGTLIVWVGLPLLLVTLLVAGGFAEVSRARVRRWGGWVPPAAYRPAGPGIRGALRPLTDPRRWLDLAFETVVAFPLRLVTFVITVTWTAVALGGLTYVLWAWSLPENSGWMQLLEILAPDWVPGTAGEQYLLDAIFNFAIGLIFALTVPLVLRGLAQLDALLTSALLGGAGDVNYPSAVNQSTRPQRAAHPTSSAQPGPHPAPRTRPTTPRHPDPRDPRHLDPAASPRSTGFSGQAWTWLATGFAAVVLLAVGWPVVAALYDVHPAVAMAVTLAHSASAVLVVRFPRTGLALAALATVGTIAATAGAAGASPWPWPVTTLLAHCLIILVLALRRPWFWAASAWASGVLVTIAAPLLGPAELPPGAVANGIVLVSVSAGVGLIGTLGRLWTLSAGRVEQAETLSADEARRRRELQERNRIARELHDVVAHSMSVINVQATTAKYRKPHIDESVQQEFSDIAESSRRALNEMRSLLAILRGDDDAPTAPVPGAGDISELIETTRASGTPIAYIGTDLEVPATVGLTAFRVIQEALSNALRHAPGAAVEVLTAVEDGQLRIRVANAAPEGHPDPAPGSGLGLAGIRERVAAVQGSVTADPTAEGGFVVAVTLPLDTPAVDPLPR